MISREPLPRLLTATTPSVQITREELEKAQDEACKDSVERMEATGQWCVTDGENRASSFATYPITDTLSGTGLAECLAPDGQYL